MPTVSVAYLIKHVTFWSRHEYLSAGRLMCAIWYLPTCSSADDTSDSVDTMSPIVRYLGRWSSLVRPTSCEQTPRLPRNTHDEALNRILTALWKRR